MKTRKILTLGLAVLMLGLIWGPALAGDGPEPADCAVLPPAEKVDLYGIFTVARDKGLCSFDPEVIEDPPVGFGLGSYCNHYAVHVILIKKTPVIHTKKIVRPQYAFSFVSEASWGDLSALTEADLLDPTFGWLKAPCAYQVQLPFGYSSADTPVIYDLKILEVYNPSTPDETMYGSVQIDVVED